MSRTPTLCYALGMLTPGSAVFPRVRVVVLNFNGGERLIRCLDALARTEWPAESLHVVVVDNASTDGSAAAASRAHPTITVMHSPTNAGFPANNLALHDLGDVAYVALVNNDAYVDSGWLAPLVAALAADASLGAASAMVLFAQTSAPTINNAGVEVLRNGYGRDRGFGSTDLASFSVEADVFGWCGAAVLLRPAYLADVGLLDARFFLYYEDTDLSWRGQLRGWRYRFVPQSTVRHDHSASTGSGSPVQLFYTERNRLLMLVKNAPASLAFRAVVRFPLSALSYALHGNVKRSWIHVRAYVGFLALLAPMLRERRRVRRRRTVDDAAVLRLLTDV
jgi:N-acetylglucosaminyl-diphospho-decaprenol L-rhamnosyltransferase